jgi:UDP-N-acetylglucosamine 4,6-dehydratase|tara:strand:- start:956 stop:1801 length:846 start_codon:yes stop_codon:yes gene_type:complete
MITKGKKYLITGGTGIIGYSLCEKIISMGGQVVVMSRGENKLKKLKEKYNEIDIVVGDICNQQIVRNIIKDIDGVFHLAAVAEGMQAGKPIESVTTNVIGSMIVLQEASNVDFVLGISSDKVVQVSGTYGATKFLMEKLFNQFEEINPKVKYRVVRLGNVIYSVDSVLYRWKSLIEKCEEVIITDKRATRFFMTPEKSVDLIINCLEKAKDSKPYFEDMKSTSIGNLLQAMINKYAPQDCKLPIKTIGLHSSENLHEKISENGICTNEIEQYTIKELEEMI